MQRFKVVALLLPFFVLNYLWLFLSSVKFCSITESSYSDVDVPEPNFALNTFSFESYRHLVNKSTSSLLLILVHSAPANFQHRMSIRKAWGHPSQLQPHNASLRFVVGQVESNINLAQALAREEAALGDVMRVDVTDRYRNLSVKSVASLRESYAQSLALRVRFEAG